MENKKDENPIFEFYKEFIYPFTIMPRQGWLQFWGVSKEDCESVAAHIFAVTQLASFVNSEYDLGLDTEKLQALALVHELDELVFGDVPVRDKKARQEKEASKAYARTKLEEKLSKFKSGKYFLALFDEFESGKSPEAKFIKEIDALAFSLQGVSYCEDDIGNTCDGRRLVEYSMQKIHTESLHKTLKYIKEKLK